MKIATQEDIDKFMIWAVMDKDIYPYLSVAKYAKQKTAYKDDWEGFIFISECGKCLLHVTIDRARDCEFNISLYSKSPILAGRGIEVIKHLIKRYKPRAINSCVHASNIKSLTLHEHVFGHAWGIEPNIAWNMGKGEYEDLYYFRMMLPNKE